MPPKIPILHKWYIIANPAAGSGQVKKSWSAIQAALHQYHFDYEVVFTTKIGHAIELAQQGIKAGYRHIMGVGGDGTNHEIINGIMMQQIVPSDEITYTLLTVGTGNDWVKTYKIPSNFKKWLPLIKQSKTTLQDIGWVKYHLDGQPQERYFTNVAGLAYDGFIGEYIARNKDKITNQFAYLKCVLQCLSAYELSKARITFDDQVIEDYFYTIAVGICRYSGGGMQFVPQAIPDDGLLALSYATSLSKLRVVLNTPRFYTGTIGKIKEVSLHQAKRIKIEALAAPVLLEADGEFLGETPVEFEILPKALKIVVP